MAGALGDQPAQPLGDRDAAAVDADQSQPLEILGLLDQLVRDPGQGALDRLGIEDDLPDRTTGRTQSTYPVVGLIPAGSVISSPFRPLWTGLKGLPGQD